MSAENTFQVGAVGWFDLTVENAAEVRDFYKAVVGWKSTDHPMGDYADFNMHVPDDDRVVTGVCHARGMNDDLPPRWLIYVNVAEVEESARRCEELGGAVVAGPRRMGRQDFCVIRDPAGAMCALVGPPDAS